MVIREFEKRVEEIDFYLGGLEGLYQLKDNIEHKEKYVEDSFLTMLQSNTFLMIYNLVESTIMSGIMEIYENLNQEEITYRMARHEIQNIWFTFKHSQVYDKEAHYNSYKKKASEIITAILTDEIIVLNERAVSISGNLDAEQIRKICTDHGIHYELDVRSRGGLVLSDVKARRNELAHGNISFVECGRNYTVTQLKEIKDETVIFLKDVLQGVQNYYNTKQYLVQV